MASYEAAKKDLQELTEFAKSQVRAQSCIPHMLAKRNCLWQIPLVCLTAHTHRSHTHTTHTHAHRHSLTHTHTHTHPHTHHPTPPGLLRAGAQVVGRVVLGRAAARGALLVQRGGAAPLLPAASGAQCGIHRTRTDTHGHTHAHTRCASSPHCRRHVPAGRLLQQHSLRSARFAVPAKDPVHLSFPPHLAMSPPCAHITRMHARARAHTHTYTHRFSKACSAWPSGCLIWRW